jgi:hypothetical protein
MVALTLFVATPLAVAPVVTTVKVVPGLVVLGAPATNCTVAGLPFVIEEPPTVAVMPTLPATVLVNVIVATPLALVVTVVPPTIVPVPLAMAKVTDALGTGLPKASTMVALTLFVAAPFANAPVVTTLSIVPGALVLGDPATN